MLGVGEGEGVDIGGCPDAGSFIQRELHKNRRVQEEKNVQ